MSHHCFRWRWNVWYRRNDVLEFARSSLVRRLPQKGGFPVLCKSLTRSIIRRCNPSVWYPQATENCTVVRQCPHLTHPPERRSERFAPFLSGRARLVTLQRLIEQEKPSSKHTTQETCEVECVVKQSSLSKKSLYPLDALRQKLSTRLKSAAP